MELDGLPVPATLLLTVSELDASGAELSVSGEVVEGPAFWAMEGETNRVLVTGVGSDTEVVRVAADARDDMDVSFAVGVVDVDRAPERVTATLTLVGSFCGDGARSADEVCDGSDVGAADCVSLGLGFVGGTLGCVSDCTAFDVSGCAVPPGCGNGVLDPGEACDGALLNNATCVDEGFEGGVIACNPGCTLDVSGCYACGDGMAGGPEECDGMDLVGMACTDMGFDSGTLACSGGCTYDVSGCGTCSNGVIDGAEVCDGMDLGLQTCVTAGGGTFQGGTLACAADCTFDTSGCFECGDGVAEGMEACDGADLGGQDCVNIMQGFVGGTLGCAADCTLDTSACMPPPTTVPTV